MLAADYTILAPLEYARFRKAERFIIKAHFLLRVVQENMLLNNHSLQSMPCVHGCRYLGSVWNYEPVPKGVSNSS